MSYKTDVERKRNGRTVQALPGKDWRKPRKGLERPVSELEFEPLSPRPRRRNSADGWHSLKYVSNDVSSYDSMATVIYEWNRSEIILTGENKRSWGKSLSQCHSVHHKYRMVLLGIEPGTLRWVAGEVTASGTSQPSSKLTSGQISGHVLSRPLETRMFISILKESMR